MPAVDMTSTVKRHDDGGPRVPLASRFGVAGKYSSHRKRAEPVTATVDHADIRGVATLPVSVAASASL
jgi:hypothetical protein